MKRTELKISNRHIVEHKGKYYLTRVSDSDKLKKMSFKNIKKESIDITKPLKKILKDHPFDNLHIVLSKKRKKAKKGGT